MKLWPTKPLLELASLIRGTEPGSESYVTSAVGTRFLRVGDITGKTDNPVYTNAAKLVHVTEDDLLLALDGTPGHVSTGHHGAISSGIRKVEVLDKRILASGWLRYALNSPDVQATIKQHTRGVTILHASSAVLHINIPLPPLAEQERIVKLLDKADELRKLRTQADRRTAALLPALFHEMFGDPVSNSHRLPTARLGKIASVERGRFSPRPRNDPSYYGGEYPFIQTGDIAESGGFLTRWKQTLNERGRSVSKEFPVGTIVIAIVGATIGQTAILGRPVYATDSVVGIQTQPKRALVEYVIAVLQHWRPVFIAQAPETARANLNAATLKAVEIPLPPLPMQKEFAQRVTEIRELEAGQVASRRRLDELFQSLLHRVFTGDL